MLARTRGGRDDGYGRGVRPSLGVGGALARPGAVEALTAGGSKAHLRLGGVSLIERAVVRLLGAGISDVIVVVGARSASVERSVARIARLGVRTVFADRWMEGNGASLAAVERELVDDPLFVVMVADHVFSDGATDRLIAASRPSVLVDEYPEPAIWSEGTRVRIRDGYVVEFSKELDEPAVDCGAFVLSPAIFEAQRRAAAEAAAKKPPSRCRRTPGGMTSTRRRTCARRGGRFVARSESPPTGRSRDS